MAVVHLGSYSRFVVVDSSVVESCHVFAGDEFAWLPVGIAMCDGVSESLVTCLQVVEAYFHLVPAFEQGDRFLAPLAVNLHL